MDTSRRNSVFLRCIVFLAIVGSACGAQRVSAWVVSHDAVYLRLGPWGSLPVDALWYLGFLPVLICSSVFAGFTVLLVRRQSPEELP